MLLYCCVFIVFPSNGYSFPSAVGTIRNTKTATAHLLGSLCRSRHCHNGIQNIHEGFYRQPAKRKGRDNISFQMSVANDNDEASFSSSFVGRQQPPRYNKDNDDGELERIKDNKFLERNQYWVVLVDDEEAIRLAVGDFLYDRGYQITACADAAALLQVCQTPRHPGDVLPTVPDAIVSDIRMPGQDGLELLTQIRASERLMRVPVILLTAKGLAQDRIAGFNAGADAYLTKPFDPEELLAILDNRILRRKQMKGRNGQLIELKQEMAEIKEMMRRNGSVVVKKTDVYLTVAEREVLELLCKGYTNVEIAQERGVGLPRIKKMMQKLYQETQTQTRTELVRWAIQTGYVPPR